MCPYFSKNMSDKPFLQAQDNICKDIWITVRPSRGWIESEVFR